MANIAFISWSVRFYGLSYKLPNVSADNLVSIINDLDTSNLNATQTTLLQNRTQDLASIPIPSSNLTALVFANGSAVTNSSGIQLTTTDEVGEFDQFVTVPGLGSNSSSVRIIETGIANVTGPGNGTIILVPSTGISVVSDIDDVMRITKVYVPNEGLFNSFVQPYVNVPGIPELYAHWNETLPGAAFHYDTTTPVELTRTYVDYLFSNFPLGSLEMRPINISDPSQILEARQNSLLKLFQTFPQRKFVLVGDTSSSTLLSAYPQIAEQFPNQIACIFIRNTSATDSDDKIPFSTSEFKNINNNTWFFYRTADGTSSLTRGPRLSLRDTDARAATADLFNLNITGGQCRNDSVPQNVTFGEQGGILGNNGALGRVALGRVPYAASFVGTAVALVLSLL
ncbi:Phosphatidate phosphatase APP1 [Trametes pubescens]|uniref:Phosphatidate phosphatase APP1 n=1 Tax=Trametes pubescens TaxID=154538 RepID=A0A1M2W2L7_TRAPU|nr:Phosphatidate phosphatase APP1 [Trametes pubescens]